MRSQTPNFSDASYASSDFDCCPFFAMDVSIVDTSSMYTRYCQEFLPSLRGKERAALVREQRCGRVRNEAGREPDNLDCSAKSRGLSRIARFAQNFYASHRNVALVFPRARG